MPGLSPYTVAQDHGPHDDPPLPPLVAFYERELQYQEHYAERIVLQVGLGELQGQIEEKLQDLQQEIESKVDSTQNELESKMEDIRYELEQGISQLESHIDDCLADIKNALERGLEDSEQRQETIERKLNLILAMLADGV
jgi:hypothetical protein